MRKIITEKVKTAIHCAAMTKEDKKLYYEVNEIYNNALPYICDGSKFEWEKRCKFFENLYINTKDEDKDSEKFKNDREALLDFLRNIYVVLAYQAEKKPDTQTLFNKIKDIYPAPNAYRFFIDSFCEFSKDCANLYKMVVLDVEEAEIENKNKILKQARYDQSISFEQIDEMNKEKTKLEDKVRYHRRKLERLEKREEAINKELTL